MATAVLSAGAGAAGEMVVRETRSNQQLHIAPVGFVDDDRPKLGLRLANLPVLGTRDDLRQIAERERVQELIIAMPRAPGTVVRKVVLPACEAGLTIRAVP